MDSPLFLPSPSIDAPSMPKLRPRAYSYHQGASATDEKPALFDFHYSSSSLLDSLDLSASVWNLRNYLLGKLKEAEEDVKALKAYVVEESEDETGISDEEEDATPSVKQQRRTQRPVKSTISDLSALEQFINTASRFLSAIREELPSLSLSSTSSPFPSPSSATSLVQFQLSPDARLALDHFLQDHPLPSFPQLGLRQRLGESRRSASESASALLARLSSELSGLQDVLTQMTINASDRGSLSSYLPSLPTLPLLPTPPLPPLSTVRDYFVKESEKVRSLAPSAAAISANLRSLRTETSDTLHNLSAAVREEASELTSLITSHSSAALDEASKMYHAALENGRKRLLAYHELPHEWRNNEHILSGYRYIPIESWGTLLRSGFEYHNETVNIQSHFLGFLSLLYVAFFLLPSSPHAQPDSHWADTAIAILFLVAGMKCLLCSTAWHLMSGCATLHLHRGAACVDYVGISGLIAASVMGTEYYGFYCRSELATLYMTLSGALGIAGMILPWQEWFNERRNKMWRVAFFLGLALSAILPLAHMAALYGLVNTLSFFLPALPSVLFYLTGLSFYANQYPECSAPGKWDNLLNSHNLWHIFIVIAVWAHWRAMSTWSGAASGDLSCGVNLF